MADGSNGGGVGTCATANDAVLGDGFNPTASFAQACQIGLPVRARYRLFANLYAQPATGALTITQGSVSHGQVGTTNRIGVLRWEFDENGNLITSRQLFLPLATR